MRYFHQLKKMAVFILIGSLLTGCKGVIPIASDANENKGYSLPEIMIFVATEKNRYEGVYTDGIWSVAVDENGTTFQTYMMEQIKSFLQQLKTMNLMAEKEQIELSTTEKEQVKQLAAEYYKGLSAADLSYMKVTEADVLQMYGEYCLANKLVAEMTKEIDLEISDSEAKVITLQQIEIWNEDTAKSVYEKTQEEGADFEAIAKEYSLNPEIQRNLGRLDVGKEYEDAAFALKVGESSGMIKDGQSYFIVKCISDYNEEATAERKKKLMMQKKEQAFRKIYNQFTVDNPTTFTEEAWTQVQFSTDDKTETTNFFELYKVYFPG